MFVKREDQYPWEVQVIRANGNRQIINSETGVTIEKVTEDREYVVTLMPGQKPQLAGSIEEAVRIADTVPKTKDE